MKKILNYLIPLILLILPTYLIRFKIGGVPTTFLEIYIYLVFVLFLTSRIKNREKTGKGDKTCLPAGRFILPVILLLIGIISAYFAENRLTALGEVKAYFFDGLLVLIMFYFYRDEKEFQSKAITFYILSGLFVSVWGILQRLGIAGLISHQLNDPMLASQISQGRILGPFESPNYLAMYIAPLIVILIIIYLKKSMPERDFSYLKKFFWPLLIIFGLTLILTQSASAMIAVVLALIFYFLLASKSRVKWLYIALVVIVLVTGVFLLSKGSAKSGSVAARSQIYQATIQIGSKHQIIGIGAGNFPDYFIRARVEDRIDYNAMHPHNIFLAFWVYMGWPGLICFLAIVGICLRKENVTKNPVFYFLLLAILFNGLTDTTFFKNDLSIIFWMAVAFLI